MNAREHEHNWYQPGAMVRAPFIKTISGANNFSTSEVATWVNITANAKTLQVAHTPDSDCWALVILNGYCRHSVAGAGMLLGIDNNGSIVSLGRQNMHALGGVRPVTITAFALFELTGGTAYTITGAAYSVEAGTLTVDQASDRTWMMMLVWKKP